MRQKKGGAIGLKATGTIARVAMEDWIRNFRKKISEAGMTVHLLTKYVDDVLPITNTLEFGARWEDDKITYHLKDILEDLEKGISKQEVTFNLLKAVANTITPYLKFTGEVSLEGNPIPVLDTQIWYGVNQGGRPWFGCGQPQGEETGRGIQYKFYSKKMTNPLGILKRSAISEGTKASTASSEVMRRLKMFSQNAKK